MKIHKQNAFNKNKELIINKIIINYLNSLTLAFPVTLPYKILILIVSFLIDPVSGFAFIYNLELINFKFEYLYLASKHYSSILYHPFSS